MMDFSIHITGFVALYIFMLAGFAGWVIIGNVPAIMPVRLSANGAPNRRCVAMSCSRFCLGSI